MEHPTHSPHKCAGYIDFLVDDEAGDSLASCLASQADLRRVDREPVLRNHAPKSVPNNHFGRTKALFELGDCIVEHRLKGG